MSIYDITDDWDQTPPAELAADAERRTRLDATDFDKLPLHQKRAVTKWAALIRADGQGIDDLKEQVAGNAAELRLALDYEQARRDHFTYGSPPPGALTRGVDLDPGKQAAWKARSTLQPCASEETRTPLAGAPARNGVMHELLARSQGDWAEPAPTGPKTLNR